MNQKDVDNLLYFEYHENKNEKFNAEAFIKKYQVEPHYINNTNVFTFLSGLLEEEEFLEFSKWKDTLFKRKNEVSTYTFHLRTKHGIKILVMNMIPILDSTNKKIEYFVGYFS